MKAVVLAGGYASRFYPYSVASHKAMVKIMGKPILEYTLAGLKEAGIKEIILRVSQDGIIKEYFGDGSSFGLSIEYIEQKESLGMGDVLLKAEKFIDNDFIFISGNHVNSKELVEELVSNKKNDSKGAVLVKERKNPWEYGIVEIKEGKLVRIVEKPEKGKEPSNLGLVSAFLLPRDIIEEVKKVEMSEFNFEQEALENYVRNNSLSVAITEKEILTLKYPWDLLSTKNYLLGRAKKFISDKAEVSKDARIAGDVIVEDGAKIMEGAQIKGPVFIGKNVVVGNNALVRDGACIEENSVVGAYMEIRNSLIMSGTTTHAGFIGDSIVGSNCKIGTGFNTANVRIDRANVAVGVKGSKVDTGLAHFGTIIGNNVTVGLKASTMPGIIIGNNAIIGASTTVIRNVEDGVTYYAKFQEIVEKK